MVTRYFKNTSKMRDRGTNKGKRKEKVDAEIKRNFKNGYHCRDKR